MDKERGSGRTHFETTLLGEGFSLSKYEAGT